MQGTEISFMLTALAPRDLKYPIDSWVKDAQTFCIDFIENTENYKF